MTMPAARETRRDPDHCQYRRCEDQLTHFNPPVWFSSASALPADLILVEAKAPRKKTRLAETLRTPITRISR
jgi:hypothetical protein